MKTIEKKPILLPEIQILINDSIGKKACVCVKSKQGKKIKEFTGDIIDSYNSHFVLRIKINNSFINKSFSYVDFLTNELSIEIF